jgi:AraC-like DNA-binding protein
VRAIHDHPEHPWTVGELAHVSAMSRSAFAARFRALTGDPPMCYVTRCRLARAARRLPTTDAALSEIALDAGYDSGFAFSRAFKRELGVPPTCTEPRTTGDAPSTTSRSIDRPTADSATALAAGSDRD